MIGKVHTYGAIEPGKIPSLKVLEGGKKTPQTAA